MVSFVYLLFFGFLAQLSQGFTHNKLNFVRRLRSRPIFVSEGETSNPVPKESVGDSEKKQVDKGLTHIKYNKYAPSAEEAASMTDEQFRGVIYKRMVSLPCLMPRNFMLDSYLLKPKYRGRNRRSYRRITGLSTN
jgi:hypothetical protein